MFKDSLKSNNNPGATWEDSSPIITDYCSNRFYKLHKNKLYFLLQYWLLVQIKKGNENGTEPLKGKSIQIKHCCLINFIAKEGNSSKILFA